MKRILLLLATVCGIFSAASAQELLASFTNVSISGSVLAFDVMLAPGANYTAASSVNGGAISLRFNMTDVGQPSGGAQSTVVASDFYTNYTCSGLTTFSGGDVAGAAKFAVNIVPGGTDPFLTATTPVKICRLTVTFPATIPNSAVMTMRASTAGTNSSANGGSGFSYSGGSDGKVTAQNTVGFSAPELKASFMNVSVAGNVMTFDVMLERGAGYNAASSVNGGAISLRFNMTDVGQPTGAAQSTVVASDFYPNYTCSGLTNFAGGTVSGSAKFAVNIVPGGADPFLTSTTPVKICHMSVTFPGPVPTTAIMTMRPSTAGSNSSSAGGSGFSYGGGSDGLVTAQNNVVLPVELLYFNASKAGTEANLEWATASESKNAGFDIERSSDGKSFRKIAFAPSLAVGGNSNETLKYSYVDAAPLQGVNYYRLKQLGQNGKSSYSVIREVIFGQVAAVNAFPNPCRDKVQINGLKPGQVIRLSDISGRLVLTQVVSAANETLNTTALGKGNYLISVTDNNDIMHTFKIVKY